jgi:phage terminase small subunit
MGYPEVAAAIRTEMAERAQRTGITPERVIAEYARIAFADMGNIAADWDAEKVLYTPSSELSDEAAAIIAYIAELAGAEGHRLEVKTFDKRRALESLARIFGLNVTSFSSFELGAHHA